jgi:hypothetical protein
MVGTCLVFSRFDDSAAFISELAVFEACSVAGRAFPFSSAAGAGGFVFVGPDFKVASAYVAFDVGGFRLQKVT